MQECHVGVKFLHVMLNCGSNNAKTMIIEARTWMFTVACRGFFDETMSTMLA